MRLWSIFILGTVIHGGWCKWCCGSKQRGDSTQATPHQNEQTTPEYKLSDDPETKQILAAVKTEGGELFYFVPTTDYKDNTSWQKMFFATRGMMIGKDVGRIMPNGVFNPPIYTESRNVCNAIVLFNKDSSVDPKTVQFSITGNVVKLEEFKPDYDKMEYVRKYEPRKPDDNQRHIPYELDADAKAKFQGKPDIVKLEDLADKGAALYQISHNNDIKKIKSYLQGTGDFSYHKTIYRGLGIFENLLFLEENHRFPASIVSPEYVQEGFYVMQDDQQDNRGVRFVKTKYNPEDRTISIRQSKLFTKDNADELDTVDYDTLELT